MFLKLGWYGMVDNSFNFIFFDLLDVNDLYEKDEIPKLHRLNYNNDGMVAC